MIETFRQANLSVDVVSFRDAARRRGLRALLDLPSLVSTFFRLVRTIRERRPDVIHGLLFHAYMAGAFAGTLARVPIVVASRRSLVQTKFDRWYFRLADRIANGVTDAVVANSEAVRRAVAAHERLPQDRIGVIHNGVAIPDATDAATLERLRADLNIAGRHPVVVVISNFIHYKGHDVFLDAWRRVLDRFPRGVALLLGDGPLRAHFEQAVRDRSLESSVRICGCRPDVPAVLSLSDVAVHPSLQEGFSNAVLEAMAAGRPVVASAVGGTLEAVVSGETGLLVPPGDPVPLAEAIVSLLDRPEVAKAFGRAGCRRVMERFRIDRMVAQYEALYEGLVRNKLCAGSPDA